MQRHHEIVPHPLPRQGQLERVATARRLIQLAHVAPDLTKPGRVTNDQPTSDADPAWLSDDVASPEDTRSALSAPENFIAESQIKRHLYRYVGKRRWPVVLVGIVIIGATAIFIGLNAPVFVPRSAIVAKEPARGSADLSIRSDVQAPGGPNGQVHRTGSTSVPQPHQDPAEEPVVSTTGANLRRQLAAAGLPSSDANAIDMTDARVTAFPPNTTVEPEPPSSVPPPAEPPVAERQKPAAVEASPAKASPPQPNPKLDALLARAAQLLAVGDVAKARQFFSRVSADGDSRGALGMARTYDEQVVRTPPVGGLTANPDQAKWWYEKAESLKAAAQSDRDGRTSASR